jgi:hypothetical protein
MYAHLMLLCELHGGVQPISPSPTVWMHQASSSASSVHDASPNVVHTDRMATVEHTTNASNDSIVLLLLFAHQKYRRVLQQSCLLANDDVRHPIQVSRTISHVFAFVHHDLPSFHLLKRHDSKLIQSTSQHSSIRQLRDEWRSSKQSRTALTRLLIMHLAHARINPPRSCIAPHRIHHLSSLHDVRDAPRPSS